MTEQEAWEAYRENVAAGLYPEMGYTPPTYVLAENGWNDASADEWYAANPGVTITTDITPPPGAVVKQEPIFPLTPVPQKLVSTTPLTPTFTFDSPTPSLTGTTVGYNGNQAGFWPWSDTFDQIKNFAPLLLLLLPQVRRNSSTIMPLLMAWIFMNQSNDRKTGGLFN